MVALKSNFVTSYPFASPPDHRRDLERNAQAVAQFADSLSTVFDALHKPTPILRGQSGVQSGGAAAYDQLIRIDPNGATMMLALPQPNVQDAGKGFRVACVGSGTIGLRTSATRINGLTQYYYPQAEGLFEVRFDGTEFSTFPAVVGPTGAPGATGAAGAAGAPGSPGVTGAPGPTGTAAALAYFPSYGATFPSYSTVAHIDIVEHFTAVSAMRGLVASVSGADASVADEPNDGGSRVGIGNCRTGTDTTGRAGVISYVNALRFGGGRHRLRWDAIVTVLSTGTDTFTTRIGFIDSAAGEPTNGAYFRYTHSVNGGRWEAVTRAAGVETATNTGITTTAAWAYFEIDVNAAGTSVVFYINGALVATNTTNIPTGGNLTGIGVSHIKSAGTNNREFRLDLTAYSFDPTTPL